MLDTVILNINGNNFFVEKIERFGAKTKDEVRNSTGFKKWGNNPTADEKRQGIYLPRLTLIKRFSDLWLKVEFSAPKLLFGNNVDELVETNFDEVAKILNEKLSYMGVSVSIENLIRASVLGFHASKNITIANAYTSSFIIKELNKINLTQKLDLNKDNFRNAGESLQCYANTHSLVIYDKIKDLRKPEKRAIDKDQNYVQKSLFDAIERRSEILRIEVRLPNKTKLNAVFKKLGFNLNPTFQDIFSKNICQKIVEYYWEKMIENENMFIFDNESQIKAMLQNVLRNTKIIKPKHAIYLAGLKALCKDGNGVRELRSILSPFCDNRTWYRISDDIKALNNPKLIRPYHDWVEQITNQLAEFRSFKLPENLRKTSDLQCKAL